MGLGRPICALWYKERISITKEKYSANEQFMYPLMAHNNNNLIAYRPDSLYNVMLSLKGSCHTFIFP